MLTEHDLQKIEKLFDSKLESKLGKQTKEIKDFTRDYVRQGVDTVSNAIDEMVTKDVGPRLKKLEKIHPEGKHVFTN
jgi:hypothetical protein